MKKLKLNLEEIKVESFETNLIKKNILKGTAFAHVSGEPCEPTNKYYETCQFTCASPTSCGNTCPPIYSCVDSCDYSCMPCTYDPQQC